MNAIDIPDSGHPRTEHENGVPATEAWPSRRQAVTLLSAMIVLGIGIDLFFFNGFYASDDRGYFDAATLVASEGILSKNPRVGHERLTVLAWNIFAGWLSGYNVQAISASYTFFHGLLIVLVYLLARRLFNRLAGVLAAYTTATFPLFIIFSTGIYPDLPIACLFALSLLAFIHAYEVRPCGRLGMTLLMMSASGASVGAAYMAKEVGLVVLPVYFMLWLLTEWTRRPRSKTGKQTTPNSPSTANISDERRWGPWSLRGVVTGAFFAIGFFAMVGLEYGVLSHLTGRSYVRMLEREKEEDLEKVDNFHRDGGYNPIARFKAAGRELGSGNLPENLKYLFGACLVAYPFIRKRNWSVYFLGLWIFAFLTVGTYSYKHYYPPRLQARYYIPAFPFLITVFAITLAWVLGHIRNLKLTGPSRRWLWRLITLAIVLTPIGYLRGIDRWSGNLYRTDFVQNMARAVNEATFEGATKIAISKYFTYRIHHIWHRGMPLKPYARRPSNVVVYSELMDIDLNAMLESGGFSFIDRPLVTEASETYPVVRTFDALLHPALSDGLPVRRQHGLVRRRRPTLDPRFFTCVDEGSPNLIEINGYELVPELRARYRHVFKSRTAEILYQFTSRQGRDADFFSKTSRPVLRYHVAARPIDCVVEHNHNLLDIADWSLADPSAAQIDHDHNQLLVVPSKAGSPGTIEFQPSVAPSIPTEFQLPAGFKFWLTFEVELEEPIQAYAELKFYSGVGATTPTSSRQIRLTQGKNEVGLFTGDRDRYFIPAFRMTGDGRFRITKFAIEACRFVTKK